jgi:hypothetical protein
MLTVGGAIEHCGCVIVGQRLRLAARPGSTCAAPCAQAYRPHRLEHRRLSRRHRETAGTALGLGGHDGVAAANVDAGPIDVPRAGV